MRILYHHRTAARDGMSVHIEELIAAFRARNHEVEIVGPASEETYHSGRLEALTDRIRRALPLAASEALELAYNVVAYRRLLAAAKRFGPDILYERYNLFLSAGVWLKRRLDLPMLLEVNAPIAAERSVHTGLSLRSFAERSEAMLWREPDVVIPVTQVLAGYVRRLRPERPVEVISNGVDLARFGDRSARYEMRARFGVGDKVVLGFVGFLRSWHGVEWAISALPPGAILLVVGEGPARDELVALAQAKGVSDRVRFTGRATRQEIPALLSAFDIALQPQAVEYASPLKLFEYMAMGLAILAPQQANIMEVLTHERDALLFHPQRSEEFATSLRRLCEDPELRTRLGSAARRTVEEKPYSWSENARRIEVIADRLIGDRRTRRLPSQPKA